MLKVKKNGLILLRSLHFDVLCGLAEFFAVNES